MSMSVVVVFVDRGESGCAFFISFLSLVDELEQQSEWTYSQQAE